LQIAVAEACARATTRKRGAAVATVTEASIVDACFADRDATAAEYVRVRNPAGAKAARELLGGRGKVAAIVLLHVLMHLGGETDRKLRLRLRWSREAWGAWPTVTVRCGLGVRIRCGLTWILERPKAKRWSALLRERDRRRRDRFRRVGLGPRRCLGCERPLSVRRVTGRFAPDGHGGLPLDWWVLVGLHAPGERELDLSRLQASGCGNARA